MFIISGALLLSVPIYLLALWFYACSQINGYPDTQILYYSYLPKFLEGRYASSLFPLPFCAIAIITNIGSLECKENWIKWFSRIVVILGGLLTFANLWSMM